MDAETGLNLRELWTKNKSVRENAVKTEHGSCSHLLMGSSVGIIKRWNIFWTHMNKCNYLLCKFLSLKTIEIVFHLKMFITTKCWKRFCLSTAKCLGELPLFTWNGCSSSPEYEYEKSPNQAVSLGCLWYSPEKRTNNYCNVISPEALVLEHYI